MQSIAETCVRFDAAHLSINLVSEIAVPMFPTLSKQSYGQCGWLKMDDAYRTVCKTSIYPKSKECPQKICPVNHGLVCSGKQGGVLVRSIPGNSSLVPSRKYLWKLCLGLVYVVA